MTGKYSDDRRKFLKVAALFGGAAVCLPMARGAAAVRPPPRPMPEKRGQGYRVTEHIREYYKAARI
jgi:hypothetical protein